MHPELFLLIGISLSLGFTPGPNNAVASFSGFNYGIKKTIPLILGVWLGYTTFVILTNFALMASCAQLRNAVAISRTLVVTRGLGDMVTSRVSRVAWRL